jgi:2-polyprenyl-3-methyl-5-hydroxy-6-metoxy-1,4-benzoquinol methylase
MKCRFCKAVLRHEFIDLVNAPPSNSFLTKEQLDQPETFYPLKLYVCEQCRLVQIDEYRKFDEIFARDYIYFSSCSRSWLDHARAYVDMITDRLGLSGTSRVIEIASNDGYLLQYFRQKHISCLGIEPTASTAQVARDKGVEVIEDFFGTALAGKLARRGEKADLLIGNNVLAHVPDINDFVKGLAIALKDNGVITMEFPHLMRLMERNQFDTIYHEHFSYFSFLTVQYVFGAHDLVIFDVEELPTHGGSLRIYIGHKRAWAKAVSGNVDRLLNIEMAAGMGRLSYYRGFQAKADQVKLNLLSFLIQQKQGQKKVAAYGAAAKGNTLLNYCGIKKDMIPFVVDASPHKQGKFLPGSHIPVVGEKEIRRVKPDYVIILPWNLQEEIMDQLSYIREWNAKFVVPIPEITIL